MLGLRLKDKTSMLSRPLEDATIRSLLRPEAAGFKHAISMSIKESYRVTSSGLLIPTVVGTVDNTRLDKVTARIIRGVFFCERSHPLPPSYTVHSFSVDGLHQLPKDTAGQLLLDVKRLQQTPSKQIGGLEFTYWSDYDQVDENRSFWALLIHGVYSSLGWTVPVAGDHMP